MHIDNMDVYGAYLLKSNQILVSQNFAWLDVEQMVYVLSHETIHWILAREFGWLTSMGLDIVYHRPLPCLGGHSLHTLMLSTLYEQAEGLNRAHA